MAERVALITGGGGGLGQALATRLRASGWRVLLGGPHPAPLEATAAALGVTAVALDVTQRASCRAAVAHAGALGALGLVVHAAGVAESAPLLPPDDALWERTLAVNATGAWHVATEAAPALAAAGGGTLVNVASTAALRGFRYVAAYVASKHALLGLTRALALDLKAQGIRVHAVCPGFLDTPMTARSVARLAERAGLDPAAARAALAALNASGRLIPPAEVAEVIARLAAEEEGTGREVLLE